MRKLALYDLKSTFDVEGKYILYRGTNAKTNESVIVKTVNYNNASIVDKAQLHHEFELLLRLATLSPHVLQPVDYIDSQDGIGLAMQDSGAKSLHEWFGKKAIAVEVFLPLAVKMAKALSEVHDAQLIHRNLNLKNILYNVETDEIYISDFSLATELKRVMSPNVPPKLLQGSLDYMAPEQTGRLNRPMTRRADLYSMGVIFYKLLTGHLPFESNDPFAIIRGHLVKEPKAISSWMEKVPDAVSEIVMKLLSKMPQDRYKSAVGLKADLEYCYHEFKNNNLIMPFSLGKRDQITQLELPDRLYGREEDINLLYRLFDNLCTTENSILLSVSGTSGIGKTSLVKELSKRVAVANGFFVAGKFDTFQQSDTYEGLRKALDRLVQYYMGLPEEEYQNFKHRLLVEVGPILRVMTDLIPRLKLIVGEPAALPEVGPAQTRNRFQLALHRFVKIVGATRPIVLLLDDVQWANESMLQLLEKLTTSDDIHNIFFVVCYRSDEVNKKHPVTHFLNAVSNKKEVYSLEVTPLNIPTLSLLLQDMLYLPEEEVIQLATLVEKKTEGNPFFFLMVLEELYRHDLISFSDEHHAWTLHNDKIKEFVEQDNVIDFIDKILSELPEETKSILHTAACIGNTFLMEELVLATQKTPQFLSRALFAAMKANIILPLNLQDEWMTGIDDDILLQSEYRFIHDKLQQGAYHLKSVNETKKMHLNIGRGWNKHYKDSTDFARVIAIADQFDKGLIYVIDNKEKELICELNYIAGSLAQSSVAHERAFYYANIALTLLPEDSWGTQYALTSKIYSLAISSAFLSHRFEIAEKYSEIILDNTVDRFEKAKILFLKSNLYRATNRAEESVLAIKNALLLYKKKNIVKTPNMVNILIAIIKMKYYLRFGRVPLSSLKKEASEEENLLYLLTQSLSEELYLSGKMLNWVYVLLTWFNSTHSTQNAELRAMGYIINGVIWPHSAYSNTLVEEAKEIIEQSNSFEHKATLYCVASILHMPWHHSMYEVLPLLKQSFEVSAKSGNLDFLSFTYLYETLFNPASTVPHKIKELEDNAVFVKDISMRVFISMKLYHQFFRNLSGDTAANCWKDDSFSLDEITNYCQESHFSVGINILHSLQLASAIFFHEYKVAADINEMIQGELEVCYRSNSYVRIARTFFFSFLTDAINYNDYSFYNKIKVKIRMYKLYRYFKKWTLTCNDNFLYYFLMMQAELARMKNNTPLAIEKYDAAVIAARTGQIPEFAGFALERMGLLHLEQHRKEQGRRCLEEALRIYEGWGALGKVKFIREHYFS